MGETKKQIYVDHSATTAVRKEVIDEMTPYFSLNYGNPSSIYYIGRESKKAIDTARDRVAKAINADSREIYFTGSGTESDNWAIKGVAYASKKKGNHIITSSIEHPAVMNTCKVLEKEGFEVTYLPVNEHGEVSVQSVRDAIKDETILITIMFANNEIGTIQPISEIGALAKETGVVFHTDAVQAVGNLPIDVKAMNIDVLSLSAHKFYGPKGVGAIFIRRGVRVNNFIHGGHQEAGKRAATENVPGIVGLGKAIELASEELDVNADRLIELRDYLIKSIEDKIPYVKLNGHRTNRLPGHVNMSFQFIEGESLLLSLDMKGIYASSGSACTSGSLDPSHVLLAIGLSHEIAHGSLRLTLGNDNTTDDIDYLMKELIVIVQKLREMSPLYESVKRGDLNV